ncbi:MAG: pyridoxal 5'-phosphate synthase lyase subunit PdxS, partial [Nitrososphaerota archaeon]
FKSSDPELRASAIVLATTYWDRPDIVAEAQKMIDESKSMLGLDVKSLDLRMQERGTG